MKKLLCFFLLIISITSFCQEDNTEINQPSKWRVGGGLGLGFGNNGYFGFSIAPFAGYEIIPELEAGITAGYQYSKWDHSRQHLFNFGPYVNYYPVPFLFARSHFEHYIGSHEYDYSYGGSNKYNFDESALWLGAGYRSVGRIQFYAGLMYNVLYQKDSSLFSSGLRPIVGVSVGL